jgi:hypothetical protein
MRKKGSVRPLPHGRGSVSCCKHLGAILSARKQAVFGLFQHPARQVVTNPWHRVSKKHRVAARNKFNSFVLCASQWNHICFI